MLKKSFLFLFVSFVFVLSCYAQSEDKAILLKSILENTATKHQVNIDFIEDEIAGFKIIPPKEQLTLEKKLAYISKITQLDFKFISEKYITVIKNKNSDTLLCGYIRDQETKIPIAYAAITVLGQNYATESNEKGYFELKFQTASTIEFSHVNYETRKVSIVDLYQPDCPEILLKTKEYQLDEVVAPVFLTKGITKKTDGSYEFKPKKFGLLPGLTEPDVLQTLLQLPGITSIDETISNVNVRGGTHDQNLFLWNGVRLFQTGHFYGLISVLNPNSTQKVNIYKNGSSAFFGDSVSSTILITTTGDNNNSSNSVGVNMLNYDINVASKLSKKSFVEVSARRSLTDSWSSPTYKSYLNRVFQNTVVSDVASNQNIQFGVDENLFFYDASVKFKQQIKEKSHIIANFITISNLLDINQNRVENGIKIERASLLNQQTFGGSFEFNTSWNDNTSTQIVAYGSFYNVESENQAIEGNQIFNQENTILDTNVLIKNTHHITDKFTFRNGYQFNEIGIKNTDRLNSPLFSRKIKDVLRNHALISELSFQSAEKHINATVGFRLNYITQLSKFIPEPRIQFDYSLAKNWRFEILGEAKSQTTAQIVDLQQDFLGLEKRRWVLANDNDVPVLKSLQFSSGISYKKNNWLISSDLFYKNVDGVSSRSQNFRNQLEFVKINGSYTAVGAELLIQKQISNIITWLTYTFTDNKYRFPENLPSEFSNNFENKHQVNTGIIYDYKQLKLSIGARWTTGRPVTVPLSNLPVNNEIVYEQPNASRIEDYFQINFSSGYMLPFAKKQKLQIGVSIQNLLDNKNLIGQYFRINSNTNAIEKVNTFGLNRTPNAFLRYFF